MAPFAAEVAVTEENVARAAMFDFLDDFGNRPAPVIVAEQESLGAEVAAERAAPRRNDGEGPEWAIAPQVQQVVTRHGQAGQVGKQLGPIARAQSSTKSILQNPGPDTFGLPDADGIAMFSRLIRMEEGVWAAQDDRLAAPAELIGDVVGAVGVESPGGNRHQVGGIIEVDGFELFVDEFDFPVGRGQSRQVGQGHRHDLPAANLEHGAVRLGAVIRWLDN